MGNLQDGVDALPDLASGRAAFSPNVQSDDAARRVGHDTARFLQTADGFDTKSPLSAGPGALATLCGDAGRPKRKTCRIMIKRAIHMNRVPILLSRIGYSGRIAVKL